jgi:hypothetical protein
MPGARATVLERLADESLSVSVVPRGDAPGQAPSPEASKARTVSLTHDLAAKIWVAQAGK